MLLIFFLSSFTRFGIYVAGAACKLLAEGNSFPGQKSAVEDNTAAGAGPSASASAGVLQLLLQRQRQRQHRVETASKIPVRAQLGALPPQGASASSTQKSAPAAAGGSANPPPTARVFAAEALRVRLLGNRFADTGNAIGAETPLPVAVLIGAQVQHVEVRGNRFARHGGDCIHVVVRPQQTETGGGGGGSSASSNNHSNGGGTVVVSENIIDTATGKGIVLAYSGTHTEPSLPEPQDAPRFVVQQNDIARCRSDGVCLVGLRVGPILLEGNSVQDCEGSGIAIRKVAANVGVRVADNKLRANAAAGVLVEGPGRFTATKTTSASGADNGTAGGSGDGGIAHAGNHAIDLGKSKKKKKKKKQQDPPSSSGAASSSLWSWWVVNNVVVDNRGPGISVVDGATPRVAGNTVSTSIGAAISVTNAQPSISGNKVRDRKSTTAKVPRTLIAAALS